MDSERLKSPDLWSQIKTVRETKKAEAEAEVEALVQARFDQLQGVATEVLNRYGVKELLNEVQRRDWGGLGAVEPVERDFYGKILTVGYKVIDEPEERVAIYRYHGAADGSYNRIPILDPSFTKLEITFEAGEKADDQSHIHVKDSTSYGILVHMYQSDDLAGQLKSFGTSLPIVGIPEVEAQARLKETVIEHLIVRRQRHQTPQEIRQFIGFWTNAGRIRRFRYKPQQI